MANVLPVESKRALVSTQRARILIVTSWFAIGIGIVAFIALLPSAVALHSAAAPLANMPTKVSTTSIAAVNEARDLMSVLQPLSHATATPTDLFTRALAHKPSGIKLNAIAYEAGSGRVGAQLQISGEAASADSIDAYRAALALEPLFTKVTVPVGALVGTTKGQFQITITGPF